MKKTLIAIGGVLLVNGAKEDLKNFLQSNKIDFLLRDRAVKLAIVCPEEAYLLIQKKVKRENLYNLINKINTVFNVSQKYRI